MLSFDLLLLILNIAIIIIIIIIIIITVKIILDWCPAGDSLIGERDPL